MSNFLMRAFSFIAFLLFFGGLTAQVGINTTTPKSTLDVNGDLFARKEIRMGGTDAITGNPGVVGQVLVSQGTNLSPVWKGVSVPFMEDKQYKLINTYLKSDQTGVAATSLSGAATTPSTSSVGEAFSASWIKIAGLSFSLEVKNPENNITYQLQSGAEMQSNASGKSARYICGIFKNNTLVALRPDALATIDANPMQGIFTLNYNETNVPIGTYTVDVACRKIYTSDQTNNAISIGVNISNTNNQSNAFALRSILKVDVAELVSYTN